MDSLPRTFIHHLGAGEKLPVLGTLWNKTFVVALLRSLRGTPLNGKEEVNSLSVEHETKQKWRLRGILFRIRTGLSIRVVVLVLEVA